MMLRGQILAFAAIGFGLNVVLYGAYLLLTATAVPALAAMSLTYAAGVLVGFALNRRITFRHRGGPAGALLRYLMSYGIGYAIDFVLLWWLAVRDHLPHRIVQGGIALVLPAVLFLLQKYWVFRSCPPAEKPLAMSSAP